MPTPTGNDMVTIDDIRDAAERINGIAIRTPVLAVPAPDDLDDPLWCKAEALQPSAAFKVRGASNKILKNLDVIRERGLVAESSGNHARAVAYVARRLGVTAIIVMPDAAPAPKIAAVRALGADVEIVAPEERETRPEELADQHGFVRVPPYDDPDIMAGQGTVGLEITEQLPELATLLVPLSGGGLLSGTATAVRTLRPDVRIIGVEPELAADAAQGFRTGERTTWSHTDTYRTVADGLRTTSVGVHPWRHITAYVDDIITVTEDEILAAMRHMAIAGRLVAEPSGAVAPAAWWFQREKVKAAGGVTAAVVSGGNVDPALLSRVLADG